MSKKHRAREKTKEEPSQKIQRVLKENLLSIHWQKIVVFLLALIPFIYFFQFFSPNVMIAGSDYVTERYALEKWTSTQIQFPLWIPHIYGGVPVFASPIGIPLAPLTWLIYLIPPQVVLAIKFFLFMFLAGLGMYLYAKEIGLSKYSAALGAFIYQFIGNLATTPYAGHAARAAGVALLPLLLFFVHRALNTRKFYYWALLSLLFALYFYEGQFQVNYYGMLFILAYVIYRLVATRRQYSVKEFTKTVVYGLISIVLFLMLMSVVWLTVLGGLEVVSRGIQRGYDWSSSWAMPPIELLDLIVPSFSGILEKYWGSNPLKYHTEYFGLLAVMLSSYATIRFWKKEYIRFFGSAFIIATLIAVGSATPLFRIFYFVIPLFKIFRAPSLIFYLSSFSCIVMACIAFEYLVVKNSVDTRKFLITSIIIASALLIMVLVASAFGPGLAGNKLAAYANNISALTMGIFLAAILGALSIAIIILGIKRSLHPADVTALLIILSLLSQMPLMTRYLPKISNPEKTFATDMVVHALKNDNGIFRILPLNYGGHTGDNFLFYHNLQSVGGASPNPLQRYQEYTGAGISVMFNPTNLVQHPGLADLLNVRYIIGPTLPADLSPQALAQYDTETQRAIGYWKTLLERYRPVYQIREFTVYQNDSVLPRAYVVGDFEVAEAGKVLNRLESGSFDRYSSVVLEDDPGVPHPSAKERYVAADIKDYTANKVVCETNSPFAGFLVLADNWHPDWKVFVDGRESKLYRANYTFRAVYIEAGKHEVAFAYRSYYFALGSVITLIGIAIILAIFFPRLLWLLVSRAGTLLRNRTPQPPP
jgi:hypothetical protein